MIAQNPISTQDHCVLQDSILGVITSLLAWSADYSGSLHVITQYMIHHRQYTMYDTPCILIHGPCITWCIMHNTQYSMHTVQYTVYNTQYTAHTTHSPGRRKSIPGRHPTVKLQWWSSYSSLSASSSSWPSS